jgi:hypothetical protein
MGGDPQGNVGRVAEVLGAVSRSRRWRSVDFMYAAPMSTLPRRSLVLSLLVAACGPDPETETSAGSSGADATTVDTTGDTTAAVPTGESTIGESTGEPTSETRGTSEGTTSDAPEHVVPEFGGTFTVIGTEEHGLNVVRDLAFNPGAPTSCGRTTC